jgi:dTMP kinase
MREVVRPALEGGKVVLCDRFSDATYAYQGAGRGLDRRFIRQVNDYASQRLKPDLTLLFDLPVEVGLARATKRNDSAEQPSAVDRFEKENLDFHRRIRDGYLALMREDPKRFRLIDASRDVDAVQKDVRRHILAFLKAGH